jgi:hypothetical protein
MWNVSLAKQTLDMVMSIGCSASGNISGIKVSRDTPSILNLLFTDDSLILMRTNTMNVEALRSVMDSYCAASGQMVSVEKSGIFLAPIQKWKTRRKFVLF